MKPPLLLFDVMDTLVYDPYAREQPAFFGLSWAELSELKDPTAWVEFELGRLDEQEYLRRFFADRRSFDHQGLKRSMARGYRWLEGMEALLQELRGAGCEIHALSNYPPWYRLIEDRLRLSRFLRWSFVSCETGVRKPQPEAFLGAARGTGRRPGECLLIDDREANCRGAEAVGMPAIRFTAAARLREELAARQLLGSLPSEASVAG